MVGSFIWGCLSDNKLTIKKAFINPGTRAIPLIIKTEAKGDKIIDKSSIQGNDNENATNVRIVDKTIFMKNLVFTLI
ncbi:hypothetical protein [Paraclostridium sordellii]|uniref:hypothetical protein n=1 Tax=Paraclostridium sordellii TaxID=1505 RepID=UPI0021BB231F|nr:hypothetical protein [Paeniclostridium sordellii]